MDRSFSKTILGIVAPILLIHGYGEDAHVWDSWLKWFKTDHINAKAITFVKDDKCGTVAQHAAELASILYHYSKVTIVAHSAGGLVARMAHVIHMIMIGSPNLGTEAAYVDLTSCAGSAEDLQPGNQPAVDKMHYYTIAGNYSDPCYFVAAFRYMCYLSPNDGLVTVASAQANYTSLGVFPYNHTGLLTHRDVYEKVLKSAIWTYPIN